MNPDVSNCLNTGEHDWYNLHAVVFTILWGNGTSWHVLESLGSNGRPLGKLQ